MHEIERRKRARPSKAQRATVQRAQREGGASPAEAEAEAATVAPHDNDIENRSEEDEGNRVSSDDEEDGDAEGSGRPKKRVHYTQADLDGLFTRLSAAAPPNTVKTYKTQFKKLTVGFVNNSCRAAINNPCRVSGSLQGVGCGSQEVILSQARGHRWKTLT